MAELLFYHSWALEECFSLTKPSVKVNRNESHLVKRGMTHYSWDIHHCTTATSLWSLDKDSLKMMRKLKTKQFDVYKSTPELNFGDEKGMKSSSGSNGQSLTDEEEMSRLEGKVTREVVLPDGRHISLQFDAKTPMMDVLIQISSQHGFLPGGKCIRVPSDKPPGFVHYKPNTPIGKIDSDVIQIVEKAEIFDLPKKTQPKTANLPFEPTVRVQVDLPRHQKTFIRVARQTPLEDILQPICVENSFHPSLHELRHASNLSAPLDMSRRLSDFGIPNFAIVASSDVRKSMSDIFGVLNNTQDDSKPEKAKGKGILGLFKKKKKETTMSAMVTDTVEVERRNGSAALKSRPVSVAGDVVLRQSSVDVDRSAKTITVGSEMPPKAPVRAKKHPAPKPPSEPTVANGDAKAKHLPLSSFAVDNNTVSADEENKSSSGGADSSKNSSGDSKLCESPEKRKSKAPPPPSVEATEVSASTGQHVVETSRHVKVTNIDEIQLEPTNSVVEQKDSNNSSLQNGHHDESGSASDEHEHFDVDRNFSEVIAAGEKQLREPTARIPEPKPDVPVAPVVEEKASSKNEAKCDVYVFETPRSLNSTDSEVVVSGILKTSTPTHAEFREEFKEIGIADDKIQQIFKQDSRASLKDINWESNSPPITAAATVQKGEIIPTTSLEGNPKQETKEKEVDHKFRSEVLVTLSPRKLAESNAIVEQPLKPAEQRPIAVLKYDGGLAGVLKPTGTTWVEVVKPKDVSLPGVEFKDPIQPDSGRGSNSSANLPPMTVKVYQGEPLQQPRSSSACSTLSSESSRPDRQSPLQISTEESLHYSPCPSSMGTSKSDDQSISNSRTSSPPKLTSPTLVIRDSQKDRFPSMQVKSFEDEYFRSANGDDFLKTTKYGVVVPSAPESVSSVKSSASSGRSEKSPVFMIAGIKASPTKESGNEMKKAVGTAVEVKMLPVVNKPVQNGNSVVTVSKKVEVNRQTSEPVKRYESPVRDELPSNDLKLQQEYEKLHKLFSAWQTQLKANEQVVKRGGKVPDAVLLDFQKLQAQMLAQHEYVQSLCSDAQTSSGSLKSSSLQSVSSGSLSSVTSSTAAEVVLEESRALMVVQEEDPSKVLERQLIAETVAVRIFSKSRSGGVSPDKEPKFNTSHSTSTDVNSALNLQKIIAERRANRLAAQPTSVTTTYCTSTTASNSPMAAMVNSEIDKSSVIRPSQLFKKKTESMASTNGHGSNGFAQPTSFTNVVKYDESSRSTVPVSHSYSSQPARDIHQESVGTVKQSTLPSVSKLAGVFSNDQDSQPNFRQKQSGATWQHLSNPTPTVPGAVSSKPPTWSERQSYAVKPTMQQVGKPVERQTNGHSFTRVPQDPFIPPPPPPPAQLIVEQKKLSDVPSALKSGQKKDVRFQDLPTSDPRENLLSAIKDFGGSHGLRKLQPTGLTRVN